MSFGLGNSPSPKLIGAFSVNLSPTVSLFGELTLYSAVSGGLQKLYTHTHNTYYG